MLLRLISFQKLKNILTLESLMSLSSTISSIGPLVSVKLNRRANGNTAMKLMNK